MAKEVAQTAALAVFVPVVYTAFFGGVVAVSVAAKAIEVGLNVSDNWSSYLEESFAETLTPAV